MPNDTEEELTHTGEVLDEDEHPDDGAAVDEVFADTEPPPPEEPQGVTCMHCPRPAVLCEEHAKAFIEQALSEDDQNRREAGARGVERAMRRAPSTNTIEDDAAAVALVIRRWWTVEKIELAQAILRILENDPT